MIKVMNVLGSSIVLSSYFFVATPTSRDPANIFVIIPFFFGIAVSMIGLSSHTGKSGVKIYLLIVAGIFILTFLFMIIHALGAMVMFYASPALIASSSLIMAFLFAKNSKAGIDGKKHSSPL